MQGIACPEKYGTYVFYQQFYSWGDDTFIKEIPFSSKFP